MNNTDRLRIIEQVGRDNGLKLDEVLQTQAAQTEQVKTLFKAQEGQAVEIKELKHEDARLLRWVVGGMGVVLLLLTGTMLKLVFG